jgi:hypothetical protein
MSQSATLYLIDSEKFELLEDNPDKTKIQVLSYGYETFEQTHEGISFLLEKFFKTEDLALIREIFEPTEFIGEGLDDDLYDSHTVDDIEKFEESAIYYLNPIQIARINVLLTSLDISTVLNAYNSAEFNNNGVYPEVWHDYESEGQAFNKTHLKENLESLIHFFKAAAASEDYVIIEISY